MQLLSPHHGFTALLLGSDKPLGDGTEVGVFVSAGSFAGGGHARYSFGNGLSVLGGIAYAKENHASADLKNSVTAAWGAWARGFNADTDVSAASWVWPSVPREPRCDHGSYNPAALWLHFCNRVLSDMRMGRRARRGPHRRRPILCPAFGRNVPC